MTMHYFMFVWERNEVRKHISRGVPRLENFKRDSPYEGILSRQINCHYYTQFFLDGSFERVSAFENGSKNTWQEVTTTEKQLCTKSNAIKIIYLKNALFTVENAVAIWKPSRLTALHPPHTSNSGSLKLAYG